MRLSWLTPLFVIGCASTASINALPGENVTVEVAERWGCDWEELQARIQHYEETRPEDKVWGPRVSWPVCEVLAAVGAPDVVSEFQSDRPYMLIYNVNPNDPYRHVGNSKYVILDESLRVVDVAW